MGNQQERFYAWLAGIIDGEGTISIQCYTKPDGNLRLTPFTVIVNSNLDILNECSRIMTEIVSENKHTVRLIKHKRKTPSTGFVSTKEVFLIRVDGYKPNQALLEALLPYLVGKKPQAETVLKFMQLRDDNRYERNSLGRLKRSGYSEEEITQLDKIRKLHGRKSSETIRKAPNFLGR